LLLDEPTSGLDSQTALKVVEMLRKEADQGMSVIMTIHQPSSQIIKLLDKLVLMSDGHTIYHGHASHVDRYFEQFGLKSHSKFTNPADKLLKIAY
jgi:ABC-type multidrug transport system ATPase subunit